MTDEKAVTTYPALEDFQRLSPDKIEVRAIGNAKSGRMAFFSDDAAQTEQAIEYEEKRELAIDEEENVDPTAHLSRRARAPSGASTHADTVRRGEGPTQRVGDDRRDEQREQAADQRGNDPMLCIDEGCRLAKRDEQDDGGRDGGGQRRIMCLLKSERRSSRDGQAAEQQRRLLPAEQRIKRRDDAAADRSTQAERSEHHPYIGSPLSDSIGRVPPNPRYSRVGKRPPTADGRKAQRPRYRPGNRAIPKPTFHADLPHFFNRRALGRSRRSPACGVRGHSVLHSRTSKAGLSRGLATMTSLVEVGLSRPNADDRGSFMRTSCYLPSLPHMGAGNV